MEKKKGVGTVNIIDAKTYGLPAKAVLEKISSGHIAIVINRSSRIIMKDGERILNYAEKIKEINPHAKISLKTTAPLCSKTRDFLQKNKIHIISDATGKP